MIHVAITIPAPNPYSIKITIENDGTGDEQIGHYDVRVVYSFRPGMAKTYRFRDWDRSRGVAQLVAAILQREDESERRSMEET